MLFLSRLFLISSKRRPLSFPLISLSVACSALGLQAEDKDVLRKANRCDACSPKALQAARHQKDEER